MSKMKMPCKLCEKSVQQSKVGGESCNHSSIPLLYSEAFPVGMQSVNFGLSTEILNNQFSPQLNMMLTAYLFRGKWVIFFVSQVIGTNK